ncbi:MAG: FAD-dependent oxidoreductase [Armatimonadota bacterium]
MTEVRSSYEVAVVGGGCAGVAAAVASAQNGARTLLVERDSFLGGDLVSGLPILGACNSLGEWVVGGVLDQLLQRCRELGGYEGLICDWRTLRGVCVDPDIMRLAIVDVLDRHGVDLLTGGHVRGVRADEGRVEALTVCGGVDAEIEAQFMVDCTGDATIAASAGAACEKGGPGGQFQPVSLVFQMGPIDVEPLLRFVRDNPGEVLLAENPVIGDSRAECARALHEAGYPYLALSAEGGVLGGAIESGEMYPCTAIFMSPTSLARNEVTLNTTRVANVDATDGSELSRVLPVLVEQVEMCARFAQKRLPGFAGATITRVAPRVGVRETRRIVGEHVLTAGEVVEGSKSAEGVAKGGHHVDIHGAGTWQKRIPVTDGRSYDIPWGCLIPGGLTNTLVAGRCISSTREANGSARVMGTCIATGQAAGTAAALCATGGHCDVRDLPLDRLRGTLREQGAILEGTH